MPPKVLLVDDEPHVTFMVARRLEILGFTVQIARDGEAGWESAQEDPPDVVVTDLQMPRLDGLELCRLLRGFPPTATTPVYLLTARGHLVDGMDVDGLRFTQVIDKPFSVRRLGEAVAKTVGGRLDDAEAREVENDAGDDSGDGPSLGPLDGRLPGPPADGDEEPNRDRDAA